MCKILLADDEYLVREALKFILQELGSLTVVGEVASGEEALELIDTSEPNIMFIDINIPGINLRHFINNMKSPNKKECIILLMGFSSSNSIDEALEMGADGFIGKPINRKNVIETISPYLPLHSINEEDWEGLIEQFVLSVFKADFRSIKNEWKRIVELIISSFSHDVNGIRLIGEVMIRKFEILSYEKGLFLNRKLEWKEKIKYIDKYTFEGTILGILEDIFEELMEPKAILGKKEIQSALNYIEQNFHKGVTLEEVADYVHLSPYYLSKLFKKELNVNFVSYVIERKIEKAKELLHSTDMPVLNIALELNYQEPNYFSKVFKKVTGMTPSEFRKIKEKSKNDILKKHHHIQNGKWYV
ncbi:MAG TPA: helix-turn-helix domain-containing protein [Chondromyces sp.]|nr:helix-turn-helix domain-containing protein [Chondromyces sp.]